MRVVAIDGPVGAGKSTVAKAVAGKLGLAHLDTGAMYRSVALAALRRGIDPADGERVATLARELTIEVDDEVRVDGVAVTDALRSDAVNRVVSTVAANPAVRTELVRRQRDWAATHDGGVIEGRDIGSVVFPDADLKVYLTASEGERARRRGEEPKAVLAERDRIDSTRAASPLEVADGALVIDSTDRTVADVVDEIVSRL